MSKHQYQQGIFSSKETIVLDVPDAEIEYYPQFMTDDDGWRFFERILQESEWRQERITIFGKSHLTPRLSCWMGDEGLNYSYSNLTMIPEPWSATLRLIKRQLETQTHETFNSVLINYYRDGQDSNGWHSDDEPELGINPTIASLSLGGHRDFKLRHKTNKGLSYTLSLEHGSLLMMRGTTQQCWQHQIPKRAKANARLNLTFRTIKSKYTGKPSKQAQQNNTGRRVKKEVDGYGILD